MFIEEHIENNSNFYHYLNLYNYTNIKLLYQHIITEVPFLEIDEDKMLSFENNKTYIKGTISNQLQEYTTKQNLINYINNTNSKYNSDNFYDKFFYCDNEKMFLSNYSKSINTTAYLGLFPFKENIVKNISKVKNKKIYFLIACEVRTDGKLFVKAFNEKLLRKILSQNNKFYNLKFKYDLKNRELFLFLKNLFWELNDFLLQNENENDNKYILKKIDKFLTLINLKQNDKNFVYQDSNKLNFLFYENENIVNNNLDNYYKTYFINQFEIKKQNDDELITIKYNNTLNNKNILNLNLNLIDNTLNDIKPTYVIKYKNKEIYLKDFINIDKNQKEIVSIVYLFNLIFKRKKIDLFYNMFFIGKDEYLKDLALNIENIDFNSTLKTYINFNSIIVDEQIKFIDLLKKIDEINDNELEIMCNYVNNNNLVFDNKLETYNLNYLNYLKKETKEEIYKRNRNNNITFFEKLKIFFNKKYKPIYKNIIEIDGKKYKIDRILNSNIGNKPILKKNIFNLKEKVIIDLNIFNNFTLDELIVFYIKSVLKSNLKDCIKTIYKNNNNIVDILPVMYGKSNILIDKIKSDENITNIIIDKPDDIPVYYLYPILYSSNNTFLLNNDLQNEHSGYWSNYNDRIEISGLLKNKINMFLKLNNKYEKEYKLTEFLYQKLNFKHNFINENNSLLSIKEFIINLQKENIHFYV